jgi:deoxyribodipyrimidine photo-lyase
MHIHNDRIQTLSEKPENPAAPYVLYWMQQAQRESFNHALEFAILQANRLQKPLVVLFSLTDSFPEANARHYAFLLQGLAEVHKALTARGILFILRLQEPIAGVLHYAKNAAAVICDRGYLRIQRHWRSEIARRSPVRVEQVESDAVVPADIASDKEEFAARTLRPKITENLADYLTPLHRIPLHNPSLSLKLADSLTLDATKPAQTLAKLKINHSIGPVSAYLGGYSHASKLLTAFINRKLEHYAQLRNDPDKDYSSHMSPYLHFGQISPLEIALKIQKATHTTPDSWDSSAGTTEETGADVYIEELVVRRELSMNFVLHNAQYDTYACLSPWSAQTLENHADDKRPFLYTRQQFENALTHDPYWNAAQREMLHTGKMHNYLRMYWGKKIIEWSPTPQDAFATALSLNNTYNLDGRDPNSFAGVAWCFGKHDRPWTRRPIFGTVRYMNAAGLERKFDIQAYVKKISAIAPPNPDEPKQALFE